MERYKNALLVSPSLQSEAMMGGTSIDLARSARVPKDIVISTIYAFSWR